MLLQSLAGHHHRDPRVPVVDQHRGLGTLRQSDLDLVPLPAVAEQTGHQQEDLAGLGWQLQRLRDIEAETAGASGSHRHRAAASRSHKQQRQQRRKPQPIGASWHTVRLAQQHCS